MSEYPAYFESLLQKGFHQFKHCVVPFVGLPLNNREDIVLIAGGTRGIGLQLAKLFDKNRYKVIILDIEYPSDIEAFHHVSFYKCDIRDHDLTKLIIGDIVERFGEITILINAVALKSFKDDATQTSASLNSLMRIKLIGGLQLIQNNLPRMMQNNRGYIVNICSIQGLVSSSNFSHYSAGEAVTVSLQKSIEEETYQHYKKSHRVTSTNPLWNNGCVRSLLVVCGRELNSDYATDTLYASKIFHSVTHNRTGILVTPLRTNILYSLRHLEWSWYQIFKYIIPYTQ